MARRLVVSQVLKVMCCESLYEALRRPTPTLAEKKTVIDVISIRDEASVKIVRWTPTTRMIADGMAKDVLMLREQLSSFTSDRMLSLVESIVREELSG